MKEFEIDYKINIESLLYLEATSKEQAIEEFWELTLDQFPDWLREDLKSMTEITVTQTNWNCEEDSKE